MNRSRPDSRLLSLGSKTLGAIEVLGLVLITIAAVIAGVQEVGVMIEARHVALADLLLLFIYLEVLSMVGVYLESGALPVRMPLYIAMVAIARHLILDMKALGVWDLIGSSLAVLILALGVLVIRFGHLYFPYGDGGGTDHDAGRD